MSELSTTERGCTRSCSRESEVANGRRNAIGTGLPPWQLAEPPDDGRRARCSRAPCQRLPLESHRCQMRLQGHVGWKRVQVPAEEVGWTLLREEKASLDCSKTNIQPEVGLERADPFIHHILSEHPRAPLGGIRGDAQSDNKPATTPDGPAAVKPVGTWPSFGGPELRRHDEPSDSPVQ